MPVTGTDYPFVEQPGAIRSYVQIDGGYSTDAWFDGLEAGRSFATNGPMLDMNVNGTGLGGELNVGAGDRLRVKASARINPDIDLLTRLDLIVQGEVIKSVSSADGAESLNMDFAFEAPAEHGTWVVLRAVGRRQSGSSIVAAVSSPIFVLVDGKSFWKPEAVPAIVAGLKKEMQIMLDTPQEVIMEAEPWDSPGQWPAAWARQEPMLADRVREAVERYDAIAEAAAKVSKR